MSDTLLFPSSYAFNGGIASYGGYAPSLDTTSFSISFWAQERAGVYSGSRVVDVKSCRYQDIVNTGRGFHFMRYASVTGTNPYTLQLSTYLNGDNNGYSFGFSFNASDGGLLPNVWRLWTYVIDRDTGHIKIYKNNATLIADDTSVLSAIGAQSLDSTKGSILGGDHFSGDISNVVLYRKALSTAEISGIYTSTPVPDFTSNYVYGNAPLAVTFTDTSVGGPYAWDWDFGDGSAHSTSQNPSHTYAKAGVFSVSLTITVYGKQGTTVKTNYINALMAANFTSDKTSGGSPLSVQYTDTSTGIPTSWDWDFGDGSPHSTAQSPLHVYSGVTQYFSPTLIATSATAINTITKTNYIYLNNVPVSIDVQPEVMLPVNIGETVTFHITASGSEPLSYQWYVNSGIIGGANASSYTIPPATAPMDGDIYQCVVTNVVGPVTSNNGILNVIVLPVIVDEPLDETVHAGDLAFFQVTATSPTYETYQWFFDGNAVGTNSNIYTRITTLSDTGKTAYCQIVNDDGMTESRHALLTVLQQVQIISQTGFQAVNIGEMASFSVSAIGDSITYQWFVGGILIPGATSSTYVTDPTISSDNDTYYSCVVSDPISQAVSNNMYLMVLQDLGCGNGYGSGSYARNVYKVCDPAVVIANKLHYYALKKINPIPEVEGVLDNDLQIEGKFLDDCFFLAGGPQPLNPGYSSSGSLLAECFPDTATGQLIPWNRVYTLSNTGSIADQQAALTAATRKKGGLSIAYYVSLAAALGYTISISEGTSLLFLIGITTLPHKLFDPSIQWTWTVTTSHISATKDKNLEDLFYNLKPAHTLVTFNYV